jgi:phosphatidylinositol-3-phosphatase
MIDFKICREIRRDLPGAMFAKSALVLALAVGGGTPPRLSAAPHRYDHIVIVVEENRAVTQIIGDRVNAPYLNTLADGGVVIGSMFALVHPSQPNYIHLFSGDNQGVTDDDLPPNFSTNATSSYPFRTPNIGAALIAAGFTFAGYSEQLEAAGDEDWADYDPHSATHPDIYYRRKHNPWANWVAKVSPIPANQITGDLNKAFTQFPTNYSLLPTVSFVIPNQLHDMHDGSRKQGDDWVRDNLDGYARWAKTNNSLLIITWDEDDYNGLNQIPTIFYGAALRDGTVTPGTWTLHNILRTIEDMYGTTHAGAAAQVRSIVGPFTNDLPVVIKSFRQGLAGYSGAADTQLWAETPAAAYGALENLTADLDTSSTNAGNQVGQVLVRFNSLFGTNAGQVPSNALIQSAKLMLFTLAGSDPDSDDTFRLHRMIIDWTDNATWDSLTGGVSTDNTEAASTASFSLVPEVDGAPAIFDVTADIELFRTGTTNRGWLIRPSSTGSGDGWTMKSSEAIEQLQRPRLEIIYTLPPTPYQIWANANGLAGADAASSADPDDDGVLNLFEFAYNLDPRISDRMPLPLNGGAGLPAARYSPAAGGILDIEFVRRRGSTGLTYVPQFANEITGSWMNALDPFVTTIDATWERVRIHAGPPGAPRRFATVRVTLQE